MTVIDVQKDLGNRTMTVVTEFDAPVERVWRLWADPRQLERWWGPPTHPATVVEHDLRAGGRVTYYMTGPEGDRYHGWWKVVEVSPPDRLRFDDGFADDQGRENPDLPVTNQEVVLTARPDGGTRMAIHATFPSTEAMEQILQMGAEEGLKQALGQIDALLLEPATS